MPRLCGCWLRLIRVDCEHAGVDGWTRADRPRFCRCADGELESHRAVASEGAHRAGQRLGGHAGSTGGRHRHAAGRVACRAARLARLVPVARGRDRLSAIVIFVTVPAAAIEPVSRAPRVKLRDIYRDARFLRLAPLSTVCIGTAWSLQGLWAAPWLEHVEGLDRPTVVRHLLLMGMALSFGALLLGWGADRLRRRGVVRETVLAAIAIAFIAAQLALTMRAPIPTYVPWAVIAAVGAATVLSFSILPEYFPKEMSAQANAALNILHLIAAFLLQYVTGVIVSLWPPEGGHPPAEAYQAAVGFGVILQGAALLWFLVAARVAPALVFRVVRPVPRISAMAQCRVVPIDYANAQLALARHVVHARAQAAHWRRIAIASAGLCLCLGIALGMTAPSQVFSHVVEVPVGSVAADFSDDEATPRHTIASLSDGDALARTLLVALTPWPSVGITAARPAIHDVDANPQQARADIKRASYNQGP